MFRAFRKRYHVFIQLFQYSKADSVGCPGTFVAREPTLIEHMRFPRHDFNRCEPHNWILQALVLFCESKSQVLNRLTALGSPSAPCGPEKYRNVLIPSPERSPETTLHAIGRTRWMYMCQGKRVISNASYRASRHTQTNHSRVSRLPEIPSGHTNSANEER